MSLIRIQDAGHIDGFRLRLVLTDGSVIERDVAGLLAGPVFEPLRSSAERFAEVRVEDGSLAWPNGADLCPDMVIWGGIPPRDDGVSPPLTLFVPVS